MYVSSFSNLYGINGISLRLGNILGPRLTHGVIFDFYNKLMKNPMELQIIGDGKQKKSYMHVFDTVGAIMHLLGSDMSKTRAINVASEGRLTVDEIADIVIKELDLENVSRNYTGEQGGWTGDVVKTDLDISYLQSLGWTNQIEIDEAVRSQVRWLVSTYNRNSC
jgi:UDP-glucose 4-epimerase